MSRSIDPSPSGIKAPICWTGTGCMTQGQGTRGLLNNLCMNRFGQPSSLFCRGRIALHKISASVPSLGGAWRV